MAAISSPEKKCAFRYADEFRNLGTQKFLPQQLIAKSLFTDDTVVHGPDGFPYLRTYQRSIAGNANLNKRSAIHLANQARENCIGLAVFEAPAEVATPLLTLSVGELDLFCRGQWPPPVLADIPQIDAKTITHVGTPDTSTIALPLRKAMAIYLTMRYRVVEPKVALVALMTNQVYYGPLMLAPNLWCGSFANERAWNAALDEFAWFVPPDFALIRPPIDQQRFDEWFAGVEVVWMG